MPFRSNGEIVSSKKTVNDSDGWSTQTDWENYQSISGLVIENGVVKLGNLPDSLVSVYEFADDTDTLIDSVGAFNGTLFNNPTFNGDSYTFNGVDQYADVPYEVLGDREDFSVAVRFSSTNTDRGALFGFRTGDGSVAWLIENRDGGEMTLSRFPASNIEGGPNLMDGNDHLVVATEDSNGAELYYDNANLVGVEGGDINFPTTDPSVARRGGGGGDDRYFAGTINEIRTYDKVLSESEISNLYQLGGI